MLPVNLVYSDGSSARQVLHFHDWFDDPGPIAESESGPLTPDTTPVLNGMDRLGKGVFEDVNDPALFETTLAVDPRKDLVAFVLEAQEFETKAPLTRSGIFAVTGVWTGSDP